MSRPDITVDEAMRGVMCALDSVVNLSNRARNRIRRYTQDEMLEELSDVLSQLIPARDDLWRAKN